jgi:peptidoglycan hydrolase CwlO-like protein
LSDVNQKLDEFRSCLEDLRDRKLNSIYQTVTSGESELHAVRLNTKNIEVDVRDVHKSLHEFTEQANTAHLKIDNVDIGVAQISQKIDQLIASHAFEAQTWLYHHLLDTIKCTMLIPHTSSHR